MAGNNGGFWKSLKQFDGTKPTNASSKQEFVEGVTDDFDVNKLSDPARRKFLALVGATAALTATACTDYRDKKEIVTYNKKPASVTYGKANYYASTLNDGQGVLVKAREGRPIKVDGNPQHPMSQGAITATAQAEMLNLYDPARLRFPVEQNQSKLMLFRDEMPRIKWETIDKNVVGMLKEAVSQGKEIAIVAHTSKSPTRKLLLEEFTAKYPTTKVYNYEVHGSRNRHDAWKACYPDSPGLPSIKLEVPDLIVALQWDFMCTDDNVSEQSKAYATRRNVDDAANFNRLYVFEGDVSLTGANADYRMRLSPESQYPLVMALISYMASKGMNVPAEVAQKASAYSLDAVASANKLDKAKLVKFAEDLRSKAGKSIVVAGNILPVEVHVATNWLNEILGNQPAFDYTRYETEFNGLNFSDMENLVSNMKSGRVNVLIHFDTNPVFNLPPDLDYAEGMKKVANTLTLTESVNESCAGNRYIIPINHALESWGDFELRNGYYSTQQPIISPIHDTRQKEALLLNWMQDDPNKYSHDIYHKFMMDNWRNNIFPNAGVGSDFMDFWYSMLEDGFFKKESIPQNAPAISVSSASMLTPSAQKSKYTVILHKSQYISDGRYANNGWLQELPNPVTKVVWDNYAAMSPGTAKELNVSYAEDRYNKIADTVEVTVNGKMVKLPVFVQPGMADNVIAVALGYGRTVCGEIGQGVGYYSTTLLSKNPGISQWIYTGADVRKGIGTLILASTQEHHSLDDKFVKDVHLKRHIIQEYTVPFYIEFEKKFTAAKKELKERFYENEALYEEELEKVKSKLMGHYNYDLRSIYPAHEYKDVKWAMSIDLNKCTGCGACVASCNVENNIAIVGKEETTKGREMQWLRIDTYFSGTPDEPVPSLQPMLCQQCDNAPCENVCPVAATTHSPDGLNQMTYNRCVGTRYCSNNCPYKVRRFNFFDFRDHLQDGFYKRDTTELLHNPEVTVRARGVMEKCTFCVQRIMEARQDAIRDNRKIQGTDVRTACQDACAASAITFGDMNDKNSDVSRLREHDLGYRVLENLAIRPNVTYIAKLRNITEEVHHGEH